MDSDQKRELYEFVKDRHDKFLAVRQLHLARIGHLLVLTGFLVTMLVLFGTPQLIGLFHNPSKNTISWLAISSAIAYVALAFFLIMTVWEYLVFLNRIGFAIPNANHDKIMATFDEPKLQKDHVKKSLARLYLSAIAANEVETGHIGRHFRRILTRLSAAMFTSVIFLVLLIATKIMN
ncbi:hypothetical protein Pan97_48560 [Bremerella volcania]|uniref:Uncharacterized protein n=1 Tax=Bremerella volcania TaxID=2527984 RepID=A0A518CEX8_9BACT|nr:hypothetical protein [Bremerella volcania]QDU77777.1 hypothetical protein Pan97_48560 [Bremerella volcania]